ncbi:MAG: rRNA (adenine1518-N6/adenine1519-N6)-dimethyltransferase [Fimbriimonadaceae bacterium]|nr:rRNA (adenine1518-N6/adenine1519-N6)-dimethyltransferase [Fimbriimonadaceae bacterium]
MNLADAATLKAFLGRHGLWASKGLGQHFLVSQKVVSAIVSSFSECRGVLEIGPGPGVLTAPLSESAERLVAIELDARMVEALKESAPKAEVLQIDALKTDLRSVLQGLPEPRGLVSNLPYYITGPLLTKISEAREHYSKAVLMMQKEVAERVLAGPKTPARGSLSVYLQLQFEIRLLVNAPAGAFMPPPKVDSAVLEFTPRTLPVPAGQADALFKLIRFSFAQPRKTLVNNLVAGYHLDREAATQVILSSGFKPTARPQELANDQWPILLEHLPA